MTNGRTDAAVRSRHSVSWWIAGAALLGLVWDMPVGYIRFMSICHSESGVRSAARLIPGKVVRLDARRWFESMAPDLLGRFHGLDAVEARDEKYPTARPPAYARYERASASTVGGLSKTASRSLDEVEMRTSGPVTIRSGQSDAAYVLSWTEERRWPRILVHRIAVTGRGGKEAAAATSVVYAWTDSERTLLGTTATEYCGEGPGTAGTDLDKLIALVAPRTP